MSGVIPHLVFVKYAIRFGAKVAVFRTLGFDCGKNHGGMRITNRFPSEIIFLTRRGLAEYIKECEAACGCKLGYLRERQRSM